MKAALPPRATRQGEALPLRQRETEDTSRQADREACEHLNSKMIAVLLMMAVGLASASVICPDGTECHDKSTCCLISSGFRCCPYPSAVCCSDQRHCCPELYSCNLQEQTCERQGHPWPKVPLLKHAPAEDQQSPVSAALTSSASVVHCDSYSVCPDGTTCCKSPYGQWFCCVYSMGQCCRDGVHCCPHGYHCDATSTHCLGGLLRVAASPQMPSQMIRPTEDLCCLSDTGCCPSGFHCAAESRECVRDSDVLPLGRLARAEDGELQGGVTRCDGRFYCPIGNSCCKTLTGQWACCPYPLGKCCKDGQHCCEYGYTCDGTSPTCTKGDVSVPAYLRKAAKLF